MHQATAPIAPLVTAEKPIREHSLTTESPSPFHPGCEPASPIAHHLPQSIRHRDWRPLKRFPRLAVHGGGDEGAHVARLSLAESRYLPTVVNGGRKRQIKTRAPGPALSPSFRRSSPTAPWSSPIRWVQSPPNASPRPGSDDEGLVAPAPRLWETWPMR
jgi:hypothetical protein